MRQNAPYDHNAHPSQKDRWTDRQTEEHHGNRVMIHSVNALR